MSMRTVTLALALLTSAAFLPGYSFAIEPDVDSPAGPELAAPTARPDFQQDDQAGAATNPQAEGADPTPPIAERSVPLAPEAVPMAPADAGPNASATSPGEENKGKPPVARY